MGPKKFLGQHFLTDVTYAERIAESLPAEPRGNVLEIGPGRGALSVHLQKRFPLFHCVEVDADVIPLLRDKLGKGEWTLHHANALAFDFAQAGMPLHVVGNLPYAIGALLIRKTLFYSNDILSCTFMVQREVAQRICSEPHSRQNGFLTIFCQFFGKPSLLFTVPPGAFFPRPTVDSAVFQLIIEKDLESKLPRSQWESYFAFVDKGFKMRRKMLANVLGRDGGRDIYRQHLLDMGVRPDVRPEDLDADQWLTLYKKTCVTSGT